jgi:putative sterol carrier protein
MKTADQCLSTLEAFAAAGRKRDTAPPTSPDRSMQLQVTDLGRSYYATLVGRHIEGLTEDPPAGPVDIVLKVDGDTLVELFSGRLSPFVALSSRRVRLDAPIRDMARLRALFLGVGQ